MNLNKYEVTKERSEADLIIYLFEVEGKEQRPLMLKHKTSKDFSYLSNVTNAVWEQSVRISTEGTQEEYNKRVDWWFDGMDDSYKSQIAAVAKNATDRGLDIKTSAMKCRMYLKNANKSKRKSFLSKFFTTWIERDVKNCLERD